jgi:hypothetical protein
MLTGCFIYPFVLHIGLQRDAAAQRRRIACYTTYT